MPTVAQPYIYAIAALPGGHFDGQSSEHLESVIQTNLPAAGFATISSDSTNVEITFAAELTEEDKAILDTLVPRCNDYFIVTTDGGVTDLGVVASVMKPAGLLSSTTVTLKYKNGDGTDSNGYGDAVTLIAPIMTIDKVVGNFDAEGKFQFIVGAELNRGTAQITIQSDSLPVKTLMATWT